MDETDDFDWRNLEVKKNTEWKPEMDALIRYGRKLTYKRYLSMKSIYEAGDNFIYGLPENFVEDLLFHLGNSE